MTGPTPRRWTVMRREDARVSPLELFFDLVFVLAITQCTALMAAQPTWPGLVRGLLVLAVLWWAWVGYAWLTSVVDPEDDRVRIAVFVAMAGLLVVSLCVPEAFGDLGLMFALAYGVVRFGQIALFTLGSPDDPQLRRSVVGLGISTVIGVSLLVVASFLDGVPQGLVWALAIVLDFGGPALFGADGWKLVPGHFAERHGLIVIIALGESIVAIGAGAAEVTPAVAAAGALGVLLAATLWWAYFDVVAIVAEQRLSSAPEGRERNELARDGYSFLHLPMVAGIVLVALGLKKTVAHVSDPLYVEVAAALCGGAGLYLIAHVAFRFRFTHTVNRERLGVGLLLIALTPLGTVLPAWGTVAMVTAVMAAVIGYETTHWAATRDRVRREHHHGHHDHTPPDTTDGTEH